MAEDTFEQHQPLPCFTPPEILIPWCFPEADQGTGTCQPSGACWAPCQRRGARLRCEAASELAVVALFVLLRRSCQQAVWCRAMVPTSLRLPSWPGAALPWEARRGDGIGALSEGLGTASSPTAASVGQGAGELTAAVRCSGMLPTATS